MRLKENGKITLESLQTGSKTTETFVEKQFIQALAPLKTGGPQALN